MRHYILQTSIILASALAACSDGEQMQDVRTHANEEAVNVQNIGSNQYEFGLTLPEGHEQLEGKKVDIPSNVDLTGANKISLICREGERKESPSKIIVLLREQSGDGSIKNEMVSFPYTCSVGAMAKLSHLDPSYNYQLKVLVLNQSGLIYKAESDVFKSSAGHLVLKMLRVSPQDSDNVLVDIEFPRETAPRPMEARESQIHCVFAEASATGVSEGSCSAEPVKRVSIDGETSVTPPPSARCAGEASCTMNVKISYPELYKISITTGACSRFIYARALPGETIKVSACLSN